jgi:hypothetical protein
VRQAFAALPQAQRETLRLAYYDGLTQEEIAERTGTPLGTVKSRTRLGLLGLRRRLADGDENGGRGGGGEPRLDGRSGDAPDSVDAYDAPEAHGASEAQSTPASAEGDR